MCRKDRVFMEHGGITIFIKEDIDYNDVNINDDNNVEALLLKLIYLVLNPISLRTVYLQPSSNAECLTNIDLMMQNAAANFNEIIVVGDYNLDLFKTNYSKKVNNLAKNSNLTQFINEATRITPSGRSILLKSCFCFTS